ncbi:hypothetical protein D9615_007047 [Tricholomella constricta]|uniref:Uncharacterized protein n=1 Tax=Tricholomella constricta TaxID=117010 RepID=A0A8H5H882_9AGAR|nr:hypothetical protein D9615_007047 [Tricholomella constricta]
MVDHDERRDAVCAPREPRPEDGCGRDEVEGEEGEGQGEGERDGLRMLDFNPMVVRRFSAAEAGAGVYGMRRGSGGERERRGGGGGCDAPDTLVHRAFKDPVDSALPYCRSQTGGAVAGVGLFLAWV